MQKNNKNKLLIVFLVLVIAVCAQVVFTKITNSGQPKFDCTPNPVTVNSEVTCTATGIGNKNRPINIFWYDPSGVQQNEAYLCNPIGACVSEYTPTSAGIWKIELLKTKTNTIEAVVMLTVNGI